MTQVSPDILAKQQAYAALPVAVRWIDSHSQTHNRFRTTAEAFAYIQQMWNVIQREVKENTNRASHLRQCYLEADGQRTPLNYVLLCEDVSSYWRAPKREPAVRMQLIMCGAMFLQILTEAEDRAKSHSDATVRANSQETVDLCMERMRRDGITRKQLEAGA